MTQQTQPTDLLSPTHLRQTQTRHFHALEEWAARQGTVAGVKVVRCLDYDLIQIVNQTWLNWAIGEQEKRDKQKESAIA